MSQNTVIKSVEIKNTASIRRAVAALQEQGIECELRENCTPRLYSENKQRECGKCDYVLHLKNSRYDVGFKINEKGSYNMILDTWQAEVAFQIGAAAVDWQGLKSRGEHYHYEHPDHGAAPHVQKFTAAYSQAEIMRTATASRHSLQRKHTNEKGRVFMVLG